MTIPWLMNCAHSETGWCLDCVAKMGNELQETRGKLTTALNMHNRHALDAWRGIDESRGHVCVARRELEAIKNRSDQIMKDCAEWK